MFLSLKYYVTFRESDEREEDKTEPKSMMSDAIQVLLTLLYYARSTLNQGRG